MSPVELIKKVGPRLAYMHLKDVDTYALKTAEGADKMGTFRALGHGTIDFPAVKAALEEIGYDGILCVELDCPEVGNFLLQRSPEFNIRDVAGHLSLFRSEFYGKHKSRKGCNDRRRCHQRHLP